jgi:hypothetical protein
MNIITKLKTAGKSDAYITKLLHRGNIGVSYWRDGSHTCFCMSDAGRKTRYINGNTHTIGYIEGFRCDNCLTYTRLE